jgi:hypothetical protein
MGIYSHVRDRWGIFNAQPFVLNERQSGVAIEGVVRQERIETSQLDRCSGFKDFDCARVILSGIEVMHMIKKGQVKDFDKIPLSAPQQFYSFVS